MVGVFGDAIWTVRQLPRHGMVLEHGMQSMGLRA